MSPAILASVIALLGAFVLSIGFVASRGGMDLTAVATPTPVVSASGFAAATVSASPTLAPTTTPAAGSSTPSPAASVTASLAPSPAPTARPTQTRAPTPAPSPSKSPSPKPTSDRYALLVACPNVPDCWIYTVRGGDNLYSIANYFGVKLAKVYAMNSGLKDTGLHAGMKLRLPPPTR